nr:DNA methyltransferase [Helicobacter pylori]
MLKEYLESIKDLTPEKNEHTHRLFYITCLIS